MEKSAKTFRARDGRCSRRAFVAAALAVASLCVASTAAAVKIKGKVKGYEKLVNPVWEEAKDPSRHLYSFREPVPTVRAKYRSLFPHIPKELCIAALGSGKQPVHKPILIRVGGGRTTPVTIVVTPGTQLQFQNTDPFTHRLYGVGIKTFQPSDTVKGGTRTWAVPGPGTFEIRDEAAPSLRMFVIGEPKVATIAYPSMEGEFILSGLEPGEYQVQAYFSGKPIGAPTPVTVQQRDLDLSRQPLDVAPKSKKKKKEKK